MEETEQLDTQLETGNISSSLSDLEWVLKCIDGFNFTDGNVTDGNVTDGNATDRNVTDGKKGSKDNQELCNRCLAVGDLGPILEICSNARKAVS